MRLNSLLARSGRICLPGDEAEIIDQAGPNLGVVTTVVHRGKFYRLTVDRGKHGRPRLRIPGLKAKARGVQDLLLICRRKEMLGTQAAITKLLKNLGGNKMAYAYRQIRDFALC